MNREEVIEIINGMTDDCAEDVIEGLRELVPLPEKEIYNIVLKDKYYNFYTEIISYIQLARAIGHDDFIWSEDDKEQEPSRDWHLTVNSEKEARNKLVEGRWFISSNGLAICLQEGIILNPKCRFPYMIKDDDENTFVFAYMENGSPVYRTLGGVKHIFDTDKYEVISSLGPDPSN